VAFARLQPHKPAVHLEPFGHAPPACVEAAEEFDHVDIAAVAPQHRLVEPGLEGEVALCSCCNSAVDFRSTAPPGRRPSGGSVAVGGDLEALQHRGEARASNDTVCRPFHERRANLENLVAIEAHDLRHCGVVLGVGEVKLLARADVDFAQERALRQ